MPALYGPLDLVQNELRNPVAQVLGSAPGTPAKGQFFFNDTTKVLQWYDGTTWVDAKSGTPSFGNVTAQTSYGAGSNNGVATTASRSDHVHGTVALTAVTPSTQAVGDAAAVGTGSAPAREDHKHAMPAFGAVSAETANFGTASGNGVAATIARSDHTHGNPAHSGAAHSGVSISDLSSPATGPISWNNKQISNLADPTNAQDAATKNYVDTTAQGLDAKASVKAASTANLTLSGTQTVDGIALVANDRILVKDQSTASGNGIYTVQSGAWVRGTDMDAWTEVPAAYVWVEQGTVNADTGWVCTSDQGGTLGSTNITWTQFSGAGSITAGNGLTKTGNTLDVVAGDTSLTVAADSVVVNTAVIATVASVTSAVTGMVKKYAAALAGNVAYATGEVVTHNLNTRDVTVSVVNSATPWQMVQVDWEATSVNTVTVRYNPNLGSGFRCVVIG